MCFGRRLRLRVQEHEDEEEGSPSIPSNPSTVHLPFLAVLVGSSRWRLTVTLTVPRGAQPLFGAWSSIVLSCLVLSECTVAVMVVVPCSGGTIEPRGDFEGIFSRKYKRTGKRFFFSFSLFATRLHICIFPIPIPNSKKRAAPSVHQTQSRRTKR